MGTLLTDGSEAGAGIEAGAEEEEALGRTDDAPSATDVKTETGSGKLTPGWEVAVACAASGADVWDVCVGAPLAPCASPPPTPGPPTLSRTAVPGPKAEGGSPGRGKDVELFVAAKAELPRTPPAPPTPPPRTVDRLHMNTTISFGLFA